MLGKRGRLAMRPQLSLLDRIPSSVLSADLWRDVICAGLLMLVPLLLFGRVALGDKTLVPADALYLFEPYRSARPGLDVQNPLLADLVLENYAWKQFLVDAVASRRLPLWDPYLFSGHTFLANGQHSALYPLTWLFFLMPAWRAFGLFTVLQLGLAGISMYILGRVVRMTRGGALVAGIVFQLSGFMVVSVVHPMIIAGAAWLPLLLALVECTVTRRRFWIRERAMLPWALLGAIALGLQILTGHPEITYFVLLVLGGFAAWRLLALVLAHPRPDGRTQVGSAALGIALMLSLGLVLGAVQLVPFYEVAQGSFRQGAVTLQDVLGWAYPKRRLITFLVPDFFGNPTHTTLWDVFSGMRIPASENAYGEAVHAFDWGIKNYVEGGAYLGILPLLLALVAVWRPPRFVGRGRPAGEPVGRSAPTLAGRAVAWLRQPYVPFFTALALFSLACVFGTPVYALVYALPFLSQSHSPFRWVFPLTVAVAVLAGLGMTRIAKEREVGGPSSFDEGRRALKSADRAWWVRVALLGSPPATAGVLAALAIWGALLGGLGLLGSWLAYAQIAPLVERAFWSLAKAAHTFADARTFYAYLFPQVAIFLVFLMAGGIVLRVAATSLRLPRRLGRMPLWQVLATVVVLADLLAFGAGFNPAVDPDLLTYTPPVVDFLKQDADLWRFSTFDPHGRNTFNMNVGMFFDLQDVRGYDSLFSGQYARYMGWIEPQGLLPYNRISPFRQFSSLDSPLTDLLNVKYILTEEEIPLPKYELVYQDASVRVYENLGVAPHAFTLPVETTVEVPDVDAVGEALLTYDPRFYAVVESSAAGWAGERPQDLVVMTVPVPGEPVAQPIPAYGANEIIIDATVEGPSWLILADAFAPGWKAFVRPLGAGQDQEAEVPIARVAGNFRAVRLDESATVRFKYSPNSVKIGAFLSFLSGMVVVFLSVVWIWRLFYRDRDDGTTVQRLAKNSIVPILLNIFNRAVDFAFAALMLRILGPANVGDYTYAINLFLWFDILTNFGLNTYLTREVARYRDQARRYLFNTTAIRLSLSLIAVPVLLGVLGARQTLIASFASPASRQAVVATLLLYVGTIPGSISTGLTALFYAFEKAEVPAAVQSVSTLLKVTLGVLVLVLGRGIIGLAGASIAVNVITLAILATLAWRLFPTVRRPSGPAEGDRLKLRQVSERILRREMIAESWPLMVNHLLATLFFKVDIFLMEFLLGSEPLGLYSIGYKFLDAAMVIPSMFTLALFPVISRQAHDDRDALVRFYRLGTKILVLIALPLALIATVAGREMVLVLGGEQYLPGAMIALRLMAWSMPIGWINSITQYVLIAVDQQRYLTRAYLLGFGFSLVANLLLMPRFGYPASALLHILAELALFMPFLLGLRRQFGTVGWRDILGKPLLAALAAVGAAALAWPMGRALAFVAVVLVYPLMVWWLNIITHDERSLLAPLFRGRQV
ncbi:MAG: oligosaccharide flippase family protein [Anaerolineae bacterium]|nr:oligosaccharide flippase family protein [Anaerolineae bacterium]